MPKLPAPTEQVEAEMLTAWLRVHNYRFSHIPNETGGSDEAKRRAVRMKRAGVSRGFPDFVVIKNNSLLFIELKRRTKSLSKVSPEQRDWLEALSAAGGQCAICWGCDEAIEFVQSCAGRSMMSKELDELLF